jgi:hypothetical protein
MVQDRDVLSVQGAGAAMIHYATEQSQLIRAAVTTQIQARLMDWQNMTPEQAEALAIGMAEGLLAAERNSPPPDALGKRQDA